jgi:DNA-binding MarR family transcriptional regulator
LNKPHNQPVNVQPLADIDQVVHSSPRLMVLTYLYVVESVDYVFLRRLTGLTWGSLATHLNKLEEVGYIEVEKGFQGKKPHTMIRMTEQGRQAFREYRKNIQQVLGNLPD